VLVQRQKPFCLNPAGIELHAVKTTLLLADLHIVIRLLPNACGSWNPGVKLLLVLCCVEAPQPMMSSTLSSSTCCSRKWNSDCPFHACARPNSHVATLGVCPNHPRPPRSVIGVQNAASPPSPQSDPGLPTPGRCPSPSGEPNKRSCRRCAGDCTRLGCTRVAASTTESDI
jgi:hypothetical protein